MFTLRELTTRLTEPIFLISWATAVVLMSIVGPFGTAKLLELPTLFFYWAAILWFAFLCAVVTELIFRKQNINLAFWPLVLWGSLFFTVFNVSVIFSLSYIFMGSRIVAEFTYWETLTIGVILYIAVSIAKDKLFGKSPTPVCSPFYKRLKPELGRDLLRITGQDHYIEVTTTLGQELVLMRFADAIDELGDCDGLQVHRSHWVKKNAITHYQKIEGKLILHLKDGSKVPVSRSFKKILAADGVLDNLAKFTGA